MDGMDGDRLTVNGDRAGGAAPRCRDARCCCCTAWTRSTRTRGFSTCSAARPRSSPRPRRVSAIRSARPISTRSTISSIFIWRCSTNCRSSRSRCSGCRSAAGWRPKSRSRCAHKLDRLILVDPVGIKLGDRETRDIADVFNLNPAEMRRRALARPGEGARSYDAMSDDELVIHARNREALCLYAWHPLLYNPQLKNWLGAHPRADAGAVGRQRPRRHPRLRPRLCRADPRRAVFELIERAGHHPEIEQPERFRRAGRRVSARDEQPTHS